MCIRDRDEDYNYMLEGYKQGILSEQRLDEAITRILATKAALGLHKKAKNEIVPNEATLNILKNEEHVKWAKNSADKAVTLVKDTCLLYTSTKSLSPSGDSERLIV